MDTTIWLGFGMIVVAAIGITIAAWPRWWIRFRQLGMYREAPEPSDLYLMVMRFTGVFVTVASVILSLMLFTWDARHQPDPPTVADQERLAEINRDAELVERCQVLLPLFEAAVQVDEAGVITNLDELESLALENDATIRPMGDPAITVIIVKVDGVSLFAVPDSDSADACYDLTLRLMAS